MAKNKSRKQGDPRNRVSQGEQAPEQVQRSSTETQQSPMPQLHGSPADVARKQQKRFGHN